MPTKALFMKKKVIRGLVLDVINVNCHAGLYIQNSHSGRSKNTSTAKGF